MGCTQSGQSEGETSYEEVTNESTTPIAPSPTELGLNMGEKWQVNPEMMVHVAASDSVLLNFDPGTENSYAQLATDLEKNKNLLISTCTMKGPAHDALHLWLMPYIGQIDQLSTAETDEDKSMAVVDLRQSFTTFHTYFQ
jgi:hypothetical protein